MTFNIERFAAKRLMRDDEIKAEKKTAKRARRFSQVMLQGAAAASKVSRTQQLFVWIWLQYLVWQANGKPFPVTSEGLEVYGINRKTKMRALATFEKAGLISVVRCKTKAPVVTLLVPWVDCSTWATVLFHLGYSAVPPEYPQVHYLFYYLLL
jgi:hypothetical protein